MSTVTVQTISNGVVSTSSENVIRGSARAWANFNGTGTVAIRASYNVSSITDNGTGDYTINFTNAFSDANYAFVGGIRNQPASGSGANAQVTGAFSTAQAAGSLRITTGTPSNGALADYSTICISIFS